MGDRAYILVLDNHSPRHPVSGVYFYCQQGGRDLPILLQQVLARRQRWDVPAHLSRMIFNAMTRGKEESDMGFGISSTPFETEYNALVVDIEMQHILICDDEVLHTRGIEDATIGRWSFEDFLNSDCLPIRKVWNTRRTDYTGPANQLERLRFVIERLAADETELRAKSEVVEYCLQIAQKTVGLRKNATLRSIDEWMAIERKAFR